MFQAGLRAESACARAPQVGGSVISGQLHADFPQIGSLTGSVTSAAAAEQKRLLYLRQMVARRERERRYGIGNRGRVKERISSLASPDWIKNWSPLDGLDPFRAGCQHY